MINVCSVFLKRGGGAAYKSTADVRGWSEGGGEGDLMGGGGVGWGGTLKLDGVVGKLGGSDGYSFKTTSIFFSTQPSPDFYPPLPNIYIYITRLSRF